MTNNTTELRARTWKGLPGRFPCWNYEDSDGSTLGSVKWVRDQLDDLPYYLVRVFPSGDISSEQLSPKEYVYPTHALVEYRERYEETAREMVEEWWRRHDEEQGGYPDNSATWDFLHANMLHLIEMDSNNQVKAQGRGHVAASGIFMVPPTKLGLEPLELKSFGWDGAESFNLMKFREKFHNIEKDERGEAAIVSKQRDGGQTILTGDYRKLVEAYKIGIKGWMNHQNLKQVCAENS